jgi:hypothetical protein
MTARRTLIATAVWLAFAAPAALEAPLVFAQPGTSGAAPSTPTRGNERRECGVNDDPNAPRCELCHDITENGRVARTCREGERGSMSDRSRVIVRDAPPNTEGAHHDARPALAPVPFRITVDGEVVDQSQPPAARQDSGADAQRRVDRRLEAVDVQIQYDSLAARPALNAWAYPSTVVSGQMASFGTFSNYQFWLIRAEVRVFGPGQSIQQKPLAVLPVSPNGFVQWRVDAPVGTELRYVLRVYDTRGRFDETVAKSLIVTDQARPVGDEDRVARERLVGWGENSLNLSNIPVSGGVVTINGRNLAPGDRVSTMGIAVPVDANGRFAMQQILPTGNHAVEVAVQDQGGRGFSFSRNLSIPTRDWFHVAIADITAGTNNTSGPADLVTGSTNGSRSSYVDGRLAFYAKGRVFGDALLTASADTREQPLRNLFSNFADRDPRFLLRRLDSTRFYPTYGDDSTTIDDAPTQGKFYVKVERGDSHVMWGSFLTRMTGTEFTAFNRALYGARVLFNSSDTTALGEKRTTIDGFAADPGTVQSREEFRGTGGSLYFLRNQDITLGSERLVLEVRDRDTGIVIGRRQLIPAQDYEINYFQGRVLLREPLESTAAQSTLAFAGPLSGNPVFLIASYEFVPGVTAVQNLSIGGRVSHWFTDSFRLGVSGFKQGEQGATQRLQGVDTTLRYAPGTFLKAEIARSSGPGTGSLVSNTGGFDFNALTSTGQGAGAQRVEGAVDLSEVWTGQAGRATAYWQNREAGFSAPGQLSLNSEAVTQRGGQLAVPVSPTTTVFGKADSRSSNSQDVTIIEAGARHRINENWAAAVGLRGDDRTTRISSASPLLSQNGSRTDVIVRIDYLPSGRALAPVTLNQTVNTLPGQTISPSIPNQPPLQVPQSTPAAGPGAGPAPVAPGSALPAPTTGMPALPGQTSTATPAPSIGSGFGQTAQVAPSGTRALTQQLAPVGSEVTVVPAPAPGAQRGAPAGAAPGAAPGSAQPEPSRDWNAYGFVQGTLEKSDSRTDNSRAGVGATFRVSDRMRVGAEASDGYSGVGGRLLGEYRMDDRRTFYMNALTDVDRTDTTLQGRATSLATGSRYRYSDATSLYGEQRTLRGPGQASLMHGFGLDHAPSDRWVYGLRAEIGTLSDPVAGDLDRRAIAASVGYVEGRTRYAGAVEFRDEQSAQINRTIWLVRNSLSYQVDPDWRAIGRLNFSTSSNNQGNFFNADFAEAIVGAAYRPVNHDRWNGLFKYTYFYNVPSPGQVGATSTGAVVTGQTAGSATSYDFAQKSHVLSADAIYRLTPKVSLGGKYAIRHGELRASRTEGAWSTSTTQFFAVRVDYRVTHEWSALAEARLLTVSAASDSRAGMLFAVYRHIDRNLRVGVGYNFTDYSDNLTDLSFRRHGFFVNAVSVW